MKTYKVAVVGATGLVGKEIMDILEKRDFPIGELLPLASAKSAGMTVMFKEEPIDVQVLTETSFKDVDFALFSAGGSVSKEFAPYAVEAGAVVIDNTSYFRMQADVPLVVPEVNGYALKDHKGIIANPNCSTAQLVMALKPIHDKVGLERVIVSTYQSVSGAGKDAMMELETQTRDNLNGGQGTTSVFSHPIAFNVIPQIDVFMENGYTKEEMKLIEETKKIMALPNLKVTATAVRVPVFVGHSEAVHIQTKSKMTVNEFKAALQSMPGVEVMDNPKEDSYPTAKALSGRDEVFVGRIREDLALENGLAFWCVSDNLRKGAALNAVQIAEALIA
jgi:aspartate-semialdehyde dehydrogenase